MIKIEEVEVWGFKHAIRGMRNPKNSWDKSDSEATEDNEFILGDNDRSLAHKLYKGGSEHRKYLRQIFVSMDITCHHTWWAEFDTYKVGTTRDSCSKMHTIHLKEFVKDDFSHEGIDDVGILASNTLDNVIVTLEQLRVKFNETHEKKYWRALIELLPMGYNIKATVTFTYENCVKMIRERGNGHKIDEWGVFCDALRNLPHMMEFITGDVG